jgi:GNAT superfamily N-acetyltransferase
VRIVRPCRAEERPAILEIVNAAAEAYRGVIPGDCSREPYVPLHELDGEIAAGVEFWGHEAGGALVGVMGFQSVLDVDLIRHAYVSPTYQRQGVGSALFDHLARSTKRRMLVGTGPRPTGRCASIAVTVSSWSDPSTRRLY